jgi:hypothetical protein
MAYGIFVGDIQMWPTLPTSRNNHDYLTLIMQASIVGSAGSVAVPRKR